MNKISCRQIFAGMLGQNFSETVKSFISKGDVSYLQISVPPAYCKIFLHEVLTIIELGFPIFFKILTLIYIKWVPGDTRTIFLVAGFARKMPESSDTM